MYYPYFLAYMVSGFVISLVVLLWALRNGQFKDQQRARFLPLEEGLETEPVKVSKIGKIEAYALIVLASLGLFGTAATLIFTLIKGG
jgi:cbb3-type cytochrome oxidase maturation protein